MALSGTLKDFGLADIFQLIGMQRKTGVLTLKSDSETVFVKFIDGQVVGAESASRLTEDLLGSVLVRTGRITEAQLREVMDHQGRTLQRMGYLLVKNGFISAQDLKDALQTQVTQVVFRLFRWRAGTYHFQASEAVDHDADFTPVSAETILMEGARMIDEWPILERRIRSADMVFRKTDAARALDLAARPMVERGDAGPRTLSLSPDERQVLLLLDGRRTVQDVVDRSSLGEFDTYRALYELLNRNLVEEVGRSVAQVGAVPVALGGRLATRTAVALVLGLALLGATTLHRNPLTPWRVSGVSEQTARLKTHASRGRLERVHRAIQVFYLDGGTMPPRLESLADAGYLHPLDLIDPWGRPYGYELRPDGYALAGLEGSGSASPALRLTHRFSPAQRMVLQGGVLPGGL